VWPFEVWDAQFWVRLRGVNGSGSKGERKKKKKSKKWRRRRCSRGSTYQTEV